MIVSQLRLVGQHPGQAVFRTLDSDQQFRRSIGNELGHDVARPVPRFDLGDSIRRATSGSFRDQSSHPQNGQCGGAIFPGSYCPGFGACEKDDPK
jgi:hypothetical protein